MNPELIKGKIHSDNRGKLSYNNEFDASRVKRIYFIENAEDYYREWQGHKVEQRWFAAVSGKFLVKLVKVDNWETPDEDLSVVSYELKSEELDILHVPAGFVSSIQALAVDSKLLVMADHFLGEIDDEYRYPKNYFKNIT